LSAFKHSVAVILPPRERFRAADAGAVALTVYDFVVTSRFQSQIVVFGGEIQPFSDVNFCHVPTTWAWLLGKNLAYAQACITLLRKQNIQLVEVHNRIILALRIKKALPRLVVAAHLHNDPHSMDGAKTAKQRQYLLEQIDAVYCVSEYVRQRLLAGVTPELAVKCHVIHNALADNHSVAIAAQKQRWLVYAGRFVPEKGVLALAQALAEVLPQFPQWRAVFLGAWGFGHAAGKSDYEQQVYAALTTVASQVEFRGHVPHSEVMATLAQSLVTVVPSTCAEAFGRVALEAMSMHNAVMVSSFGALPEIAGSAAIVLPEVSKIALAQQLTALLHSPERIELVAAACQQRAHQQFNIKLIVHKLDAIRAQLLH
jgi:glycosyltransferase involved in cell wall biosynthesis